MLFEKLESPRELFTFKLGSALKMENKLVDALGDLEGEANSAELKQAFAKHREQTRGHVRNVEMAFEALGETPDDKPDPVIEAITKEGKVEAKKSDDRLVDAVLLGGAADTEHHEIAVYETLIAQAETMGQPAIVNLLRENLEQEQQTLEQVKIMSRRLMTEVAAAV